MYLAYSWARPAIFAAGKGRGGIFLFLLFLHCHSFSCCPGPLFHLLYYISSSNSLLPFFGRQHKFMTHKGCSTPTQSVKNSYFFMFPWRNKENINILLLKKKCLIWS